ncbi:hypothetical protein [Escherichia coli]|uniref:hypothetical protein n=1 Tax=Escherichia coli TaxID=562 RepID=UPI00210E936D
MRRRMPQLARAPASLRRPGALQQGGALYCACERQRATGAIAHYSAQALILWRDKKSAEYLLSADLA